MSTSIVWRIPATDCALLGKVSEEFRELSVSSLKNISQNDLVILAGFGLDHVGRNKLHEACVDCLDLTRPVSLVRRENFG